MANPDDRESSSWIPTPPWGGLPPLFGAPWERQEPEQPRARVAVAPPPPPKPRARPMSPGGPGCRAADSCLLVHGYLVQLADGKSGFGVLRVAKERLEEGAAGADRMGEPQLAQEMRAVAQELPQVTTPEAAAALAPKLKALSDQTWDLGRRCGGHNLNPELVNQARLLAAKVDKGETTKERAVADLTEFVRKRGT